MKAFLFSCLFVCILISCQNQNGKQAQNPDHPVSEDDKYITQEYVDSLTKNRQQNLVDLRRDLAFSCVDLMPDQYIHVKLKVMPDGSYEDPEILDKEEVDMESIRDCINNYFKKNKIYLGELKDLPSSGKTTNSLPHVYTLLIY